MGAEAACVRRGTTSTLTSCEFFQREVSFLGHVINDKGACQCSSTKVKAVSEWPQPKTRKEVKGFLGLTGYYRKFVKDYSKVALPLTELTKNTVAFVWGDEQQRAFEELKTRLQTAPVLAHPDPSRQFILNSDASGFAVAAVLSQQARGWVYQASGLLQQEDERGREELRSHRQGAVGYSGGSEALEVLPGGQPLPH